MRYPNKVFAVLVILAMALICGPAHAYFQGQEKIVDPELLDHTKSGGMTRVIVTLSSGKAFNSIAYNDDKSLMAQVQGEVKMLQDTVINRVKSPAFSPDQRLDNLPVFSALVDEQALQLLASLNEVQAIEADQPVEMHTAQGIPQMNVGGYRGSHGGEGVAVAIVDTGVNYAHPALGGGSFPNSKIIGGFDVALNRPDPMDKLGHGSACAAIVAGIDTHAAAFTGGVAPKSKIYGLKVFSDSGSVPSSAIFKAWDWCITHQFDDKSNPIMIISTSMGTPRFAQNTYCDSRVAGSQVAAAAVKNGIALFVSSGNEARRNGIASPACLKNTIAVGAVYDRQFPQIRFSNCQDANVGPDHVTCYSNSGEILDILAPSHCATSAYVPGSKYEDCFGGTSAACPYAAGAAAVVQSYFKKKTGKFLPVENLVGYMKKTGVMITDPKSGIQRPRVDVARLVQAAGGGGDSGPGPGPGPGPAPGPGPGDGGGGGIGIDQLRDALGVKGKDAQ